MNKSNVDLGFAVGFGLMAGGRPVFGIGNNPDVDAAGEDIWGGDGAYPWMTVLTSLELVSSSASDTAAGVGARTVLVQGLDIDFNEVNQLITLNGITPVSIPTPLFRINRATVVGAGTTGTNVGTILVRDAGGGITRTIVNIGFGTTRLSQYTVPAGHTMQIVRWVSSINMPTSTRDATLAFYYKPFGMAYRLPFEITVAASPFEVNFHPGPIVAEKSDFGIRCVAVSTANTNITSSWIGVLMKNTDLIHL